MQPSLDSSVTVHADQILRWTEITYTPVQFLEALKRAQQKVKILWEGNILDITKSHGNSLDVDPCRV